MLGLRSGDPGGERGELDAVVSDRGVERIALGPLSAAAVGAIVRAQLDEEAEEAFCAACWELTGGNPLFVRELLAAAREEGLLARGGSVAGAAADRAGGGRDLGARAAWADGRARRSRSRARSRCSAPAPRSRSRRSWQSLIR